jgi:hypothetical protein
MLHDLTFIESDKGTTVAARVEINQAVIAGWTGRDPAAVEKHIAELEELGVKRPASTPIFYRVSAPRLTTAQAIEASGAESSGEVEFVLLCSFGRLWVGIGSDHTDRHVETYNVTVSKQMCDKPIAPLFWALDDVKGHWDQLILRSFIVENGARVLYQEGTVSAMLAPEALLHKYGAELAEGTLMYCGTLAARGGIRPSTHFSFEIEDPILNRRIEHGYDIASLPVYG